MDNYSESKLSLKYYPLILLWLSVLTVSLAVCLRPVFGTSQQTSKAAKNVRHYAASLASEGLEKDDIQESLKDRQLDQQIKAVHSTLTALFQLNTNLMFVDLSDLPETAKNYAVAVEDIGQHFPELAAKFPDGTILLAKELVEDKFLRGGLRKEETVFLLNCSAPKELSLVAVNGIIAHELAHLLQKKRNCLLRGKERELNADFLAGWALSNRVVHRYYNLDLCNKYASDTAMASSVLFTTFANLGDDRVVSPDSYISNPHGVSDERYKVIKSGFNLEGRDLDAAYEASIQFVRNTPFSPVPLTNLDGIFSSIRRIFGSDPWKCSWDAVVPTSTMTVFPPTFTSNGCQMTIEQRRSIDYRIEGKDYKDEFLPPFRASAQIDTLDLTNVRILSLKELRKLPEPLAGIEATGLPDSWYEIRLDPIQGGVPPSSNRPRPRLTLILPNEEIAKAATAKLVSAIKVCQSNVDSHVLFESRK